MAPKLALTYDSQAGNGIAGVGWNLSGLSTIIRCPRTFAVDGVRGGVNHNVEDRLCLDGQRLILQSGTYGQPNAVYYTAMFGGSRVFQVNDGLATYATARSTTARLSYNAGTSSQARIQSATSANVRTLSGNSNVAFRVQTKAGEVMEYASADLGSGVISRMWLLIRVIDVKGNHWLVDYNADSAIGEYLPKTIRYTGNDLSSPVTPPYNSVEFVYEPRPDPTTAYVGGARVSNTQRLTTIRTRIDNPGGSPDQAVLGTPVTEYRLSYYSIDASATRRSLLRQAEECAREPSNGSWACLVPITFGYNAPLTGGNFTGGGSGGWSGHGGLYWDDASRTYKNNFVGDFNGDGKSDAAAYTRNGPLWHIAISTGTGFNNYLWSGHGGGVDNNFLGDFNGDGKTDLAAYAGGGQWHIALSNGAGFDNAYWYGHGGGPTNNVVGDFNGDGRSDLAGYAGNGQWHIATSNGAGFDNAYWAGHGGGQNNNVLGDFNGDGMTDMAGYAGNGQWHVCLSTGSAFSCAYWAGHGESNPKYNYIGDYNGDGKSDMMAFDLGTLQWHVCLSTGKGFACALWLGHGGGQANNITADFNGDGRTDIAGYTGSNGVWHVCLSLGNGFSCSYRTATGDYPVNAFIGDYNGDGLSDFAGWTGSGGLWQIALADGVFPDLLTSVTSSFGLVTSIQHQPLSNTSAYYKEFSVAYPKSVVSAPVYVVTRLNRDNGVGGVNTTNYLYGTAVSSQDGRGFLGFRWQELNDTASGVISRTTFRQDWPFTGTVELQETWLNSKSTLIKRASTTPAAKVLSTTEPLNASSCADGATGSRPTLVFVSQAVEESWDIDSARTAMPKTQTSTTVDCFGNALTVQVDTLNGDGSFSGYRKITTTVVENWVDSTKWLLNRVKEARVTSSIPTGRPLGDPPPANNPATVSLTSPAAGATFTAPASIVISASASDPNGTITKVEFYRGTTLLNVDTAAPYTYTWTSAPAGTYSLTAKAYDNAGAVTTSAAVNITVNNALPAVSITAPANNASFASPAAINITATASDPNGTISKVEFYSGATLLGTDTASPYSFTWNVTALGSYALTAKAYDNAGAVSTSAPVTVIVDVLPTVTLTAPATGSTYTAPATVPLTATASDSNGTITKVEFYNGSTLLGTDTTAPYSFSWAAVPVGTYSLTAKAYDNAGASKVSTTSTITVNNALPTVSLTAPANGATFNAPASITLAASATDPNGTIAKVEFYNGTTLIATDTTAPYSTVWSNVAVGTYSLTAKAYDNAGAVRTSAAVSVTVNNSPPTVSITAPAGGSSFAAPATITINANASDPNGTISKVEFYRGTTLLGTDTASPYSYTWSNVAAGSYSLTAKAYDNAGAITTSAAVAITVTGANNAPTVSMTSPANGATFTAPASISLAANATDSDGTISKVEFYNGATLLNTDTAAPYAYTWPSVAQGTYTLTAKAYDNVGGVTTSSAVTITVNNALPVVTLTAPTNGAAFNAPATVAMSATASDPNGTIAKVEFYNGAALLGTSTSTPFAFTWNSVPVGTYSITAKAYDNAGATTTSGAASIVVNNVPPTVAFTSPSNGATYTAPASIPFSASAADANGSVSRVDYYANWSLIGSSTAPPYSFTWNGVGPGSYTLVAQAFDNNGAVGYSEWINVSVAVPPLAVSLSPSAINASRAGSGEVSASTTVLVSGGQAPYSYSWVDLYGWSGITVSGGQVGTFTAHVVTRNNCENNDVYGTFRVTVTDAGGRTATADVNLHFWSTSFYNFEICP